MRPKSFYSGFIRQVLLICLVLAVISSYKFFKRSASSAELTDSSVYSSKARDGINTLKGFEVNANQILLKTVADPPSMLPTEGPGGPILVIRSAENPFTNYYAEILRAEGFNEFSVENISSVSASALKEYDVVLLGEMDISASQVALFAKWVTEGGTLIAFRPNSSLSSLLGIMPASGVLSDKYLLVNTNSGPGSGITDQTIQFHGSADLCTLNGATSLATIYSSGSVATNNPAVTMKNVGTKGGKAIAFMYDLARSVVYTRQGNPAWAGQKRDGQIDPIRPDDLFFPDWLDFNKIAIPQADEQQRLLANIMVQSSLHRKPLPRFWYLPRDLKAAIIMTGDNHTIGPAERFYQYFSLGTNTAQDVADWKSVRATAYIYPNQPITDERARFFEESGFEISLHTNTGCLNYTPTSLQRDFREQLARFAISFPDVAVPLTNRSHCLNWSDWSSTPKVELQNGIRLDATYYYWPETWMQNRPGMFTGSGMPMRFADMDGSMIDVYQVPTQITDETNMDYSNFCNVVLDRAIGPEGYYGVFCANMHSDSKSSSGGSDAIIASAQARQIPVISARQMLNWLDGKNNSSFSQITWEKNQLSFSLTAANGAYNLKAMLPLFSETGKLATITSNDNAVPFTSQTIKGIQYAFFAPDPGTATYIASYATDAKKPAMMINQPELTDLTANNSSGLRFFVNVTPNPSPNYFNVVLCSSNKEPATITVSDKSGKIMESYENLSSTSILRLGRKWNNGTYFVNVSQGKQNKVIEVAKVNY